MGWHQDCLHKRGRYWHISYQDESGEQRTKSTRRKDYEEAKIERDKFFDDLRNQRLPNDMAGWRLQDAVDEYVRFRQATAARRTWQVERGLLRQVVGFFGPDKRLNGITAQDLRAYQIHRRQHVSKTMKRAVQPRSINYELYCLARILKSANLWEGRLEKHYDRLRQPRPRIGKAISPSEAVNLFRVAQTRETWEVAFLASLLAYASGCRGCEVKTLRLDSIFLETNCIIVRAEFAKNGEERQVALNAMSKFALRRLLERARELGSVNGEHFLLPHDCSKHTKKDDPERGRKGYDPARHQTSWASAWRSLKKEAGLPTFRFHDLRHTFNTQGAEAGVPIAVLMAQVGHMDARMSAHYTHIQNNAKFQAARLIEERNGELLQLLASSNEQS